MQTLYCDEDCRPHLDAFGERRSPAGVAVRRYGLTSNPVHLILTPPPPGLGRAIGEGAGATTASSTRGRGVTGQVHAFALSIDVGAKR